MTEEMQHRLLNALDAVIERIADAGTRLERLEFVVNTHAQILSSAKQAYEAHQGAIGQIGEGFADVHAKMRQLNSNELALQNELIRQREEISALRGGLLGRHVH